MQKTTIAIAGFALGAILGALAVVIVKKSTNVDASKDARMPAMAADDGYNVKINFVRAVPHDERPSDPVKYRGEFRIENNSSSQVTLFALPGQDSNAPVTAHYVHFAILVGNFWWESPKPIDLLPVTVVISSGESRTAFVNLETVANIGTDYECKVCIDRYWSEPFRLERLKPN